jgi:hypothetical protein
VNLCKQTFSRCEAKILQYIARLVCLRRVRSKARSLQKGNKAKCHKTLLLCRLVGGKVCDVVVVDVKKYERNFQRLRTIFIAIRDEDLKHAQPIALNSRRA